jgi:hypothetical protein
LRQHVPNQPKIIIFQPKLAKVVRHLQHDGVILDPRRPDRMEPKIVNVGVEQRSEQLLRRRPDRFCGRLHFYFMSENFSDLFTSHFYIPKWLPQTDLEHDWRRLPTRQSQPLSASPRRKRQSQLQITEIQ